MFELLLGITGYTRVVEDNALPPCVGTANGFAMPPVVIIASQDANSKPNKERKNE